MPGALARHDGTPDGMLQKDDWWLLPLFSSRSRRGSGSPTGVLGMQARPNSPELAADEGHVLDTHARRIAQALDDMTLQADIIAALEGLLPQLSMARQADGAGEEALDPGRFTELVRAALRHYWGGPGLTRSNLLELNVVHAAMNDEQGPANALRSVLRQAMEQQRPDGKRRLTSPEWTLYNILELRFVERRRVRDVAARLALSEADLYRKQRVAIEAVATALLNMEQQSRMN